MEHLRKFFPLILAAAVFGAPSAHGAVITEQLLADGTPDSGPRILWQGEFALLAFYDAQGMLNIQDFGKPTTRRIISSQNQSEMINSWIDLSRYGNQIYALWRPRLAHKQQRGGKIIMFSASQDGGATFSSPTQLNTQGGAFHPRPLVQGGEGWLYLVWADERLGPEGIYFNRSADGGRTWLETDLRIDRLVKPDSGQPEAALTAEPKTLAHEPFLAASGATVWLGWGETSLESWNARPVLKWRISEDGGTTWSAAAELPMPEARVFNMTLLRTHDKGLVLLYYVQRGGIQTVRSEDDGKTWDEIQLLGGTVAVGGQRFKTVQNQRGTICLTWEGPNELRGKKADVFVTCSQDFGKSWPDQPIRLDTNEPWLTHSLAPRMAMDDEGNVVVVWQDSRHVRSNIYLNYSRDGGRRWRKQDVRLDSEPGRYQSTYPWVESGGQGRFLVAWRTKTTDGPDKTYKLSHTAFALPDTQSRDARFPALKLREESMLSSTKEEYRRARLEERINKYWQALIEEDYAEAFKLMDPFYRASSNIFIFGGPLSKLRYLSYRFASEKIKIRGNFATFKIKVMLEAPDLIVKGVKTPIARREIEFPGKWVWIDDDWYQVFEHNRSNLLPL